MSILYDIFVKLVRGIYDSKKKSLNERIDIGNILFNKSN